MMQMRLHKCNFIGKTHLGDDLIDAQNHSCHAVSNEFLLYSVINTLKLLVFKILYLIQGGTYGFEASPIEAVFSFYECVLQIVVNCSKNSTHLGDYLGHIWVTICGLLGLF